LLYTKAIVDAAQTVANLLMINLERWARGRRLPDNTWWGVTIEDQANAQRADVLRKIKAAVRFVSAEPLLGPLSINWRGIHWCIIGGESGVHLYDQKVREQRAGGLCQRQVEPSLRSRCVGARSDSRMQGGRVGGLFRATLGAAWHVGADLRSGRIR